MFTQLLHAIELVCEKAWQDAQGEAYSYGVLSANTARYDSESCMDRETAYLCLDENFLDSDADEQGWGGFPGVNSIDSLLHACTLGFYAEWPIPTP